MAFTLCTSGAATIKAGANVSPTILANEEALNQLSNEAEGRIEAETRRKWVDNFSGLDTGIQNALSDVCSSLIAMELVNFNPTVYLTREADLILNVQDDRVRQGMKVLKDFKSNVLKDP